MLLAHAIAMSRARSALATLADRATSAEASIEYDRVLLELDWMHDNPAPGFTPLLEESREVLFNIAENSLYDLFEYGNDDDLDISLLVQALYVAHSKDHR